MKRPSRVKLVFLLIITCLLSFGHVSALSLTGSEVRGMVGQPDMTTKLQTVKGVYNPASITMANGKLYLAVVGRVNIYNSLPTANFAAADSEFGNPNTNYMFSNFPSVSASSLGVSYAIYTDGSKFYVADSSNNRVLIWNTIPTVNTPADVVLGQPGFTTTTANNSGLSAKSLSNPRGVWVDNGKLFVSDSGNNRILVWNSIPTTNFENASYAIGQPNVTSNTANNGGLSAHSLNYPRSIMVNNGKLFISDGANNRILIYDTIPTSNVDASWVIGQPNFTSNTANNGGVSGASISLPYGMFIDNGKLYVSDSNNNRILVFDSVPSSNHASANLVIGQPDMSVNNINNDGSNTSNTNVPTNKSLYTPSQVWVNNGKVVVSDLGNQRVLIYNQIPTQNYPAADVVIGHPDFTHKAYYDGGSEALIEGEIHFYNGKAYVIDQSKNRILIWNNEADFEAKNLPDIVIGQHNLSEDYVNNGGLSASSLNTPASAITCNGKFIVSDYLNHRVLIWNTFPTTNFQPANVVIGQPDFTTAVGNNGGLSAKSVYYNASLGCINDTKLVLGQYWNNRVLIFNTVPTTNFAPADFVLGQPNFASSTANNGGISAHSMVNPIASVGDNGVIYVAEYANSRVLIYTRPITQNNQDADIVLGQPNFTSNTPNNGGLSASSLSSPQYAFGDNSHIFVSDFQNQRILVWNSMPTTNGQAADLVIGQDGFDTAEYLDASKHLNAPVQTTIHNKYLYVYEYWMFRITKYSLGPHSITVQAPTNTKTSTINLSLTAKEAKEMRFGSTSDLSSVSWVPYSTGASLVLGSGDGQKTAYVQFRDYANYESDVMSASTVLDTTAPTGSIVINNNDAYTGNTQVTLTLTASDLLTGVSDMMISSDETFTGATWENFSSTKSVALPTSDGTKTVYVKFRDGAGNESLAYSDSIALDLTGPQGSVVINNGAEVTNSKVIALAINATDELSGVAEMQISENSSFTGSDWESYATTKDLTLSAGDSVKTIYVRFKDAVGNVSQVVNDTITLDTTAPKAPRITDIGLISNVPDKSPLTYYFTSQTPYIQGTAEANSTVYFAYGSHTYSAKADSNGKFAISINNPELPREQVGLSYYAIDVAGNKSSARTLTLIIGEENFPIQPTTSQTTSTPPTSTPSVTPTITPSIPVPTVVIYEIFDVSGKPVVNQKVTILNQEYNTNFEGKVSLEATLAANQKLELGVNGQKIEAQVNGQKIMLESVINTQVVSQKKTTYWWLLILVIVVCAAIYYYSKKQKEKN